DITDRSTDFSNHDIGIRRRTRTHDFFLDSVRDMRNKIASFCDVEPEAVIESLDVKTIYSIPLNVQKQNMDQIVLDHFDVQAPKADMSEWIDLEHHVQNLSRTIKIALERYGK
ncbi:hypothetical protein WP50_17975, partial [Lactiplantibacillus plantarum]